MKLLPRVKFLAVVGVLVFGVLGASGLVLNAMWSATEVKKLPLEFDELSAKFYEVRVQRNVVLDDLVKTAVVLAWRESVKIAKETHDQNLPERFQVYVLS